MKWPDAPITRNILPCSSTTAAVSPTETRKFSRFEKLSLYKLSVTKRKQQNSWLSWQLAHIELQGLILGWSGKAHQESAVFDCLQYQQLFVLEAHYLSVAILDLMKRPRLQEGRRDFTRVRDNGEGRDRGWYAYAHRVGESVTLVSGVSKRRGSGSTIKLVPQTGIEISILSGAGFCKKLPLGSGTTFDVAIPTMIAGEGWVTICRTGDRSMWVGKEMKKILF